MAKTIGGLFSIEASGQFAKSLVFDKRGRVRVYVRPSNPQTTGQGDQRTIVKASAGPLTIVGATAKAAMREAYGSGWFSAVVGKMAKSENYSNLVDQWNALDGATQTAWNDAGTGAGLLPEYSLPYGSTTIPCGQALYSACLILSNDGVYTGDITGAAFVAWLTS